MSLIDKNKEELSSSCINVFNHNQDRLSSIPKLLKYQRRSIDKNMKSIQSNLSSLSFNSIQVANNKGNIRRSQASQVRWARFSRSHDFSQVLKPGEETSDLRLVKSSGNSKDIVIEKGNIICLPVVGVFSIRYCFDGARRHGGDYLMTTIKGGSSSSKSSSSGYIGEFIEVSAGSSVGVPRVAISLTNKHPDQDICFFRGQKNAFDYVIVEEIK